MAVLEWSKGRSDRRAFRWVTGISLLMLAGSANNWPVVAMQLKTAEPVTNQLVIVDSRRARRWPAVRVALRPARRRRRVLREEADAGAPSPAVFRRGCRALAAALATAGIAAALTALVTPAMPVWPDLKMQSFAWPWAGALTGGPRVHSRRDRHAVPAGGGGSCDGRMDAPHFACRPFPGAVRRRRRHCLRQRTARRVAAGDRRRR